MPSDTRCEQLIVFEGVEHRCLKNKGHYPPHQLRPPSDTPRPATTSRHPLEDLIPERYAVNAFDQATREVNGCGCLAMPCRHVTEYNRARVDLLDAIYKLHIQLRAAT